MNQKRHLNVKNVVLIAMFSALAAVLETLQVPVPFAPPFYKLDFAELPVLIGAFAMGPVPAVLIAVVKNILKLFLNGTSTYYVGEVANIIGSVFFAVPAALIYRKHKTKKMAMVGLGVSVLSATVGAVLVNCFITLPAYALFSFGSVGAIGNFIAMGTKVNPAITNIYTFAVFAIVPFNLLKCGLNAVVTALVYKRVSVILHADTQAAVRSAAAEKA